MPLSTTILTQYKARVADAHAAIVKLHEQAQDIEKIVRQTAVQTDHILNDAWHAHFKQNAAVTLIAVGGYGRNELNVNSDIDLLFLHDFIENTEQSLDQFGLGTFVQFLWDIGLEVGHSVRSLDDCMKQANQDITIMTNLLESRFLAGNNTAYQQFDHMLREKSDWTDQSFYQAKVDEQLARHERFDDTTYKLEPNIKKSPGGLRDIQTISWIANKIYGTSDPDHLNSLGLLTKDELALFKQSRNTIWSIRNALHLHAGRAEDRLLFSYQQDIANQYNLVDKPGLLAIEQLMRKYYRAAHDIRRLNELIIQLIDEQLNQKNKSEIINISDDFFIENKYLSIRSSNIFKQNTSNILTVFKLYQAHHKTIKGFTAKCARAIRSGHSLIDEPFRQSEQNLGLFFAIFKADSGLTHTLRKMHEYGVLGAFIPEFRKIEGQMQHDLFHAYTVDAHTLMVIRNLRRCLLEKFKNELPHVTKVAQSTEQRYRVYFAALFHDIAKGRGGNHDKLGAIDAEQFCIKLKLPKKDIKLITWLVLNHLKMSKVSQREDLSDSDVIEDFAQFVGNEEYLDNLYILTVADIRSTSSTTWTAWKGHLLQQLYTETKRFLRQPLNIPVDDKIQISSIQSKVLSLIKTPFEDHRIQQYWQMLDDEYFQFYKPETIAWHAQSICQASALDLPLVETRYIAELEAEQYLIYTADSDVLLTTVTSVIDRSGQNIVQARIHAANPGFTVLIITVASADGVPDDVLLSRHLDDMRTALLQSREQTKLIKKRLPARLKQFEVEPKVRFSSAHNESLTTLSITALDQPGLIHIIAIALAKCRIRLISAHITTTGEKAEDRFIISLPNQRKALTDAKKDCLRSALLKAL